MNRILLICSAIVIPLSLLVVFFQWAITSPYEEVVLEENGVEEVYLYRPSKSELYSIDKKEEAPLQITQVTPRTFRIKDNGVEKLYLKDDFEIRGYEFADSWTLIDLDDVIVHVFKEEERERYGLDRLYASMPILDIK
jgi:hypothetical protein